jgi:septum formation protein
VAFTVVAPEVEERSDGDPRSLVIENAIRKARAVEGERVLGADTAVALDGRVFGKPADEPEAETFLRRLSGRTHRVWSGLALREAGAERTRAAATAVTFRALERRDLDWYLASGEWRGRAGAYAIQGKGAALVQEIRGDYWNVVGLPVAALLELVPDLIAPR